MACELGLFGSHRSTEPAYECKQLHALMPRPDYRTLGFSSYPAYLRSAHWQDTKQRYRDSDLAQDCYCCGDEDVQLHHKTYEGNDIKRRSVAVRFARLARSVGGVEEVRLHETLPDLELTLVMNEPDLEKELALRGLFIELVTDDLGPEVGTLSIFTEAEEVPGWVRDGTELT